MKRNVFFPSRCYYLLSAPPVAHLFIYKLFKPYKISLICIFMYFGLIVPGGVWGTTLVEPQFLLIGGGS